MVSFAGDLRVFFRSSPTRVSFAGVATYTDTGEPIRGILNLPLELKLQSEGIGGAQVSMPELQLPCTAFSPMPDSGDIVTVDGTDYLVYPPTSEDDGAILCYQLKATQ